MTEFETYCTGITLILYTWCSFLLTMAVGCYLYYTYILYCNRYNAGLQKVGYYDLGIRKAESKWHRNVRKKQRGKRQGLQL